MDVDIEQVIEIAVADEENIKTIRWEACASGIRAYLSYPV